LTHHSPHQKFAAPCHRFLRPSQQKRSRKKASRHFQDDGGNLQQWQFKRAMSRIEEFLPFAEQVSMSLHEDHRVSVDGSVEYLPGTEPGILHGRHPARTGHGPSPLEHKIEYDAERNNRDSFEESTYYESEDGHDIKYKTLTWKKVFLLEKRGN